MTGRPKQVRVWLSWTLFVAGIACGAAALLLLGITATQLASRHLRPQTAPGHWSSLWLYLTVYPLGGAIAAALLLHVAWKLRR